jgi:hypothetical protein
MVLQRPTAYQRPYAERMAAQNPNYGTPQWIANHPQGPLAQAQRQGQTGLHQPGGLPVTGAKPGYNAYSQPTSLEDLAGNFGSSPTFAPPGLAQFGGVPPGQANGWEQQDMEKFGMKGLGQGGPQGRMISQLAALRGGGAAGGFGGFPRYARGIAPRRRRRAY